MCQCRTAPPSSPRSTSRSRRRRWTQSSFASSSSCSTRSTRSPSSSPGFVWRLKTEDGDATGVRGFGDDRLIINLSVWESIEALGDFVYRSHHAAVMRRRREWFEQLREAYTALWWVPAGWQPSIAECEERVASLRSQGPTPYAFTFKQPFAARDGVPAVADGDWLCPSG